MFVALKGMDGFPEWICVIFQGEIPVGSMRKSMCFSCKLHAQNRIRGLASAQSFSTCARAVIVWISQCLLPFWLLFLSC